MRERNCGVQHPRNDLAQMAAGTALLVGGEAVHAVVRGVAHDILRIRSILCPRIEGAGVFSTWVLTVIIQRSGKSVRAEVSGFIRGRVIKRVWGLVAGAAAVFLRNSVESVPQTDIVPKLVSECLLSSTKIFGVHPQTASRREVLRIPRESSNTKKCALFSFVLVSDENVDVFLRLVGVQIFHGINVIVPERKHRVLSDGSVLLVDLVGNSIETKEDTHTGKVGLQLSDLSEHASVIDPTSAHILRVTQHRDDHVHVQGVDPIALVGITLADCITWGFEGASRAGGLGGGAVAQVKLGLPVPNGVRRTMAIDLAWVLGVVAGPIQNLNKLFPVRRGGVIVSGSEG
jgi:hypothetical protein